MKADLHLHSRFSRRPSAWLLQKIGCAESYSDPRQLYRLAQKRGMTAVTLTDHNEIGGCLEIAELPNTFISCEVTTYFPADRCKLHVLVYDISEAQFGEIDRLRENVFDLVGYLNEQDIVHALAHPCYTVNDKLTVDHFEQCVLLFNLMELNGDQDAEINQVLQEVLGALTPGDIERLADKHGLEPVGAEPWRKGFLGGSDDHSSLHVARTYTEVGEARDLAGFWRAIAAREALVRCRRASTPVTMAHHVYGVAYQFYRNKFRLSRFHEHNVMMRFLDRMLTTGDRERSRLTKFYFRMKDRLGPRPATGAQSTVMQLLQYEARKLILEDRRLATVLEQAHDRSQERDRHWFRFVNQTGNKMLGHVAQHVVQRLTGANPFDLFHTIGSAGALYTMIAPYFMTHAIYSKNRQFSQAVARRFGGAAPSNTPRVGLFTDTFTEVNGVARTLNRQVRMAHQTGKAMQILTCRTAIGAVEHPGVRYFDPVGVHDLPEYPEQKLFIPPLLEMLRHCYNHNFSYIHGATPGPLGLAALAIARILNVPFCSTYHTAMPQYAWHLTDDAAVEDLMWRYMVWFYEQADMIFSPSRATAAELVARGISEQRIRIMPRGVDTRRFHPDKRRRSERLPEGFKLLYVGRVSKEKNMPLLCRAFKELCRRQADVHLVVVGNGPFLAQMKKEMRHTPTLFTDYLDGEDLAEVYASCDAFVFPSTTDTFGNVVLEAQASGLGVIVTDRGGPQENLRPDETGLIVPADDEGELIKAMAALAGDGARARRMGAAARRYAETRAFAQAFDRYWDHYRVDQQQRQDGDRLDATAVLA